MITVKNITDSENLQNFYEWNDIWVSLKSKKFNWPYKIYIYYLIYLLETNFAMRTEFY